MCETPQADQLIGLEHDASDRAETKCVRRVWDMCETCVRHVWETPQADQLIGLEHDVSDRAETIWHPR